jgi:acetyl esterase/lipase
MLAWFCSKGYVAAGINYTLADEKNHASVLTQSNEIKAAMPKVVEAAKEAGYPIDKMTIAGGSAGHGLQNDNSLSLKWIQTVEQYLDKYMPVK